PGFRFAALRQGLTEIHTAPQRKLLATALKPANTRRSRLSHQNNGKLDGNRLLVEVLMRIAHVGVFRFVTDFRRKFRIACMNVRDVRRQNRIIAVVPNWKRKRQNFNKTRYVSCPRAAQAAPNAITSPSGIAFRLVDLVNRHKKVSRSDEKI